MVKIRRLFHFLLPFLANILMRKLIGKLIPFLQLFSVLGIARPCADGVSNGSVTILGCGGWCLTYRPAWRGGALSRASGRGRGAALVRAARRGGASLKTSSEIKYVATDIFSPS